MTSASAIPLLLLLHQLLKIYVEELKVAHERVARGVVRGRNFHADEGEAISRALNRLFQLCIVHRLLIAYP